MGPLERLLILGLALAGQFGAAGLVVGAKGLLRFPELTRSAREDALAGGVSIDVVTEYLLVGSLASWAMALAPVLLLRA